MDSDKLKPAFLFVISYILLYIISIVTPLKDWAIAGPARLDYMLWFSPIVGFFFIFLLIPYLREDLGFGQTAIYLFPLVFAILAFLGYYTSVFWYFDNQAFLGGVDISVFHLDYLSMFINSEYIYFVLGGLFGWGSKMLLENFESQAPAKSGASS